MAKDCVVKKLWDAFTPYVQIAGFIFMCGAVYQSSQNAMADVKDLKSWKDQTSPLFAAMQQDLHDLHEWYRMDHKK